MAEASDDLLLVELVCLQFEAAHGLHGAVVLQALLSGQIRLQRGPLVQAVQLTFLGEKCTEKKTSK